MRLVNTTWLIMTLIFTSKSHFMVLVTSTTLSGDQNVSCK